MATPSDGVCNALMIAAGSSDGTRAAASPGVSSRRRHPERLGAAVAAQKLVVALGAGGELEAADRVEARQAVVLERPEQRDGGLCQPGHRARAAELEDEARGVRRGAARLPERTLVDEHDVAAAERER